MAKDDMEVIIYKILRYMYECMKRGELPKMEDMCWHCKMFDIPEGYWNSIMHELVDSGYVKGVFCFFSKDGWTTQLTESTAITLEGVNFLNENNRMKKAAKLVGSGFEILLASILNGVI